MLRSHHGNLFLHTSLTFFYKLSFNTISVEICVIKNAVNKKKIITNSLRTIKKNFIRTIA